MRAGSYHLLTTPPNRHKSRIAVSIARKAPSDPAAIFQKRFHLTLRCRRPIKMSPFEMTLPWKTPAAEMATSYGANIPVLDWRERLVCSQCGGRQVDMVLTGTKR